MASADERRGQRRRDHEPQSAARAQRLASSASARPSAGVVAGRLDGADQVVDRDAVGS